MQHAALAERFDEVGRTLEAGGHRIIIRKARALIEAGDFDAAVEFLEAAAQRQRGLSLDVLAEAVTEWATDGGDVDALISDPKWKRGREREDRVSVLIGEAMSGDLRALAGALAQQQRALAEGKLIEGLADEPVVSAPLTPPVEPIAPTIEKPAVEKPAFEKPAFEKPAVEKPTFEKPAVEKPAVEKPAELEAREPAFDDGPDVLTSDDAYPPTVPDVAAMGEPEIPVFAPADDAPDFGEPPAHEVRVTEVDRPGRSDEAVATGGNRMMGPIVIAIGIAAAIAAYYFL